jgi:hypothetical protein
MRDFDRFLGFYFKSALGIDESIGGGFEFDQMGFGVVHV